MNYKLTLISIVFVALVGAGCNTSGEEQKSASRPYKSEATGENVRDCGTLAPHNPYGEGTGHYAGYEWAQENGANCNGNSESFNQGCAEYERQQTDYDNCVYKK